MATAPLESIMQYDDSGDNAFAATFPMIVQSNGFDLGANPSAVDQARIEIRDNDLFDGQFDQRSPYFELLNADQLLDFKNNLEIQQLVN